MNGFARCKFAHQYAGGVDGAIAPARSRKGFPGAHNAPAAIIRKKRRSQNHCSEQDVRASGFSWYAREPQLMCGAKGRASSQRSIDYHIPPRASKGYFGKGTSALTGRFPPGGILKPLPPPLILLIRRTRRPIRLVVCYRFCLRCGRKSRLQGSVLLNLVI